MLGCLPALGIGWARPPCRPTPTEAEFELEFLFGARLTAWNGFAIAYLALGLRAFSHCDRAELVRRVLAKPLPTSRVKRWLLAGGGGPGWPVVIALVAFATIVTAVLSRDDATNLVLALAAGTVVTCWMVITFSFALQYARRDIEQGGLRFPGSDGPVFRTTSTSRLVVQPPLAPRIRLSSAALCGGS